MRPDRLIGRLIEVGHASADGAAALETYADAVEYIDPSIAHASRSEARPARARLS